MSALPVLSQDESALVARAEATGPLLRDAGEAIDEARQLPAFVLEALHEAGCFRMSLPLAEGGLAASIPAQVRTVEAVASANGSAGWCVMIGSANNQLLNFAESEVVKEISRSPRTVLAAAFFPSGRAERVPGGYRVSGRWPFASGIMHSEWVVCGADVFEGGAPVTRANGTPLKLSFAAPVGDVKVLDTWNAMGLRGSGSHDFVFDALFVPERHAWDQDAGPIRRQGPLHAFRTVLVVTHPGVPMGIARGAMQTCLEVIRAKPGKFGADPKDQASVHMALSDAYVLAETARSFVYDTVAALWQALLAGRQPTDGERIRLRLANTHAHDAAARSTAQLYQVGGSAGIYLPNALERFFRDAHAARQHVIANRMTFETAGRSLVTGKAAPWWS